LWLQARSNKRHTSLCVHSCPKGRNGKKATNYTNEVYGKAGIVDVLSKLCHCRFLVLVVLFSVKFGNGVLINVEMELSILLQYDMRQNKEQRELV